MRIPVIVIKKAIGRRFQHFWNLNRTIFPPVLFTVIEEEDFPCLAILNPEIIQASSINFERLNIPRGKQYQSRSEIGKVLISVLSINRWQRDLIRK